MTMISTAKDGDGVVTLSIAMDRPFNVICAEFLSELDAAVAELAADDAAVGAILTSGLASGFMAGADITELKAKQDAGLTPREAADWIASTAAVLRRLELCGKPVVAALNGLTLGGGYELALACHRRILLDKPGVSVGLPEVSLGLLPGGGGTQRLPRMIGVEAALPLLLTGRTVAPAEALSLGLVDALASDDADLIAQAKAWILSSPSVEKPWDVKGFKIPGGTGSLAPHAMKTFMANTSRAKADRPNEPAPRAILSAVYDGTQTPFETGMRIEARRFGALVTGAVAGNLVRNFLRRGEAKKKAPAGTAAPMEVRRLGVLGAGMMGAGIANHAAGQGIEVVLLDRDAAAAAKGRAHAEKMRGREVAKGRLTQDKADAILSRITATADYADLDGCDLIVEAVFESRAVKAEVSAKAEPMVRKGGVYASNTSTLSITSLSGALADPTRFIGLHFFSPVERMPLLEIIRGRETSDQTVADALAFAGKLKKIPIVVNDSPGFYTSRVFCTYIDEAMAMLAEGVSPVLIENVARQAGFPAPPLAVTDEVSLDLQKLVIDQAEADGLDARFLRAHSKPVVEKMNALGRLGRKSGGGFYEYLEDGSKRLWPGLAEHWPLAETQPSAQEVRDRLLCIQALESARCLAEGVIGDEATADLGSVFGIGFPAWTGGALSVIKTMGEAEFAAACARLSATVGPRFEAPAETLARAAAARAA